MTCWLLPQNQQIILDTQTVKDNTGHHCRLDTYGTTLDTLRSTPIMWQSVPQGHKPVMNPRSFKVTYKCVQLSPCNVNVHIIAVNQHTSTVHVQPSNPLLK